MDFRIECEECEAVTYITSQDAPEFCPMCGRRSAAEPHREIDFGYEEDDE